MCEKCGGWKVPKGVVTGYAGKFCFCEEYKNLHPVESSKECNLCSGCVVNFCECECHVSPQVDNNKDHKCDDKSKCMLCDKKYEDNNKEKTYTANEAYTIAHGYQQCPHCKISIFQLLQNQKQALEEKIEKLKVILWDNNGIEFSRHVKDDKTIEKIMEFINNIDSNE